ncbi:MAG TPA: glycosyltransferase family 2 protein [Rhodocyclaceae bacterium]
MRLPPIGKFAYGLVAILGLLALVAYSFTQVVAMADAVRRLFSQDLVLLGISLYLLVFLCLLILRYLGLIVYSFMEHLAVMQRGDADHAGGDREGRLPLISLIVPAYNEALVIQPALRTLASLDYPDYEVIVVDDGSTDATYELASQVAREQSHVPIRVVTKRNGGKADALNTGIALARGEFVMCVDGDTKVSRNALRAMVAHFDDPHIAAVAGNVKVLNRENMLTRLQALEYVEGLAMVRKAQSFMRIVNIIPGPCGMFRKSVVRQVGGYDTDTFAEDCDLTLKILLQGWHVGYEPQAIGWVETPSRLLDLLKQRYRWTRGILQAMGKHLEVLRHPVRSGWAQAMTLWYMLFEGIMWPISNVLGNIFFCYVGLKYGVVVFIAYWWLQLLLLDVIASAYCVIVEREEPWLIPYAVLFRLYYILIIDVAKVLATLEQFRGTHMTWGKLEREGKLS